MVELLATAADARAAAGDDPLVAHLLTRWVPEPESVRLGGAVAVWSDFWGAPELNVVGDPADAARLVDALLDAVPLDLEISVPTSAVPLLPEGFPLRPAFTWAFRWTDAAPPTAPPRGTATWLSAADTEVAALLERGFPDASMRPGDPHVRAWAGVRTPEGRLVACAADATGAETLAFLASITSDPAVRGRGFGYAATAFATEGLLRRHGRVGLWHMGDNLAAARLYDALGYRRDHPRTVIAPPGTAPPAGAAGHAG